MSIGICVLLDLFLHVCINMHTVRYITYKYSYLYIGLYRLCNLYPKSISYYKCLLYSLLVIIISI